MNNLTLYFIQFTVATIQYLLKLSKYLLNTYPFLKKICTKYLTFSHKNENNIYLHYTGPFFHSHIPLWLCHERGLSLPRVLEWATLSTPYCALTPWPKATGQGRVPSFPFHHSAPHSPHLLWVPSPYWLRMYWMSYFRSEGWFHRCHHTMREASAYLGCRSELL